MFKKIIIKIKDMKKHPNSFLKRRYMNLYNYYFIKLNNLKNYSITNPNEIQEAPNSKQHSRAILDGWLYLTNKLIQKFKQEHNLNEYNFLDIGSGNGLPLIFVKKKFNFNSVSGFDLFKEIVERSRDNIKRSGEKDINVFVADANSFVIPNQKNLIYMFNPFSEKVLRSFMKNNIEILKKTNSVIAYYNQIGGDLKVIRSFAHKSISTDRYYGISLILF